MDFFVIAFLIIVLDLVTAWGIVKTFPRFGSRHRRSIRVAFIIQVTLSLIIVLGGFFLRDHARNYRLFAVYYYLFGVMLAVYFPKVLFLLFLAVDRLLSSLDRKRRRNCSLCPREPRHILAKCGIICCLFYMGLIGWGILFGRYQYTIEPVELKFDTLPTAFDGYKIVQISDIHAGSFAGVTDHFGKAVDMINGQHPDMIVFTGDIVNNFADEAYPLIPILSRLEARDGKYAVLGNHDYGIYYDWPTPAEQEADHAELERTIALMGFRLLNNQAVTIGKDSTDRMALIGVENWGIPEWYPKRGDVVKAMEEVRHIPFKVLLSHDPSFWTEKVAGKTDIPLTLSGHTHGMQMGIKFGKKRFSPARIQYRYWGGIYRMDGQYLYINCGLGVIGYPGRIGMPPEITVITLRCGDGNK